MSEITQNLASILTTTKSTKQAAVKKPTTKRSGGVNGGGKSKPMKNAKQQPLKVVYISNPMKVEVSAAGFRSLVQELTGRNAVDWANPTRISRVNHETENASKSNNDSPRVSAAANGDELPEQPETVECIGSDLGCFGDDLVDQMMTMENFPSFYRCLQQ